MKTNGSLRLPAAVRHVIETLNQQHYEAFLVGGCVRDWLLGRSVHDYDITTNALPQQISAIFSGQCRVIPTGIRHGTLTLRFDAMAIEVTTYRIEQNYIHHRTPQTITFTDDLIQDLSRRDFTINAMAMHPQLGIIDPFDGQRDLKKKRIRCVGDPSLRIEEDALRILRAFRFSCTLNFSIDPSLRLVIRQKAALIECLSKERIREELIRILESEQTRLLQALNELKLLPHLFPELIALIDLPQKTPWHLYDAFTHTDIALDQSIHAPLCERLALIYHDCAKAQTMRMDENGIAHFKGHPQLSAQIAEKALRRLCFDKETIRMVTTLIRWHDTYVQADEVWLRQFLSNIDFRYDLARSILRVQRADNLAKNPALAAKENETIVQAQALLDQMEAQGQRYTLRELAVNGDDLRTLGLAGRQIKEGLQLALQQVLEDPHRNTKEQLLSYLRSLSS